MDPKLKDQVVLQFAEDDVPATPISGKRKNSPEELVT
jgi:hypothetical protein